MGRIIYTDPKNTKAWENNKFEEPIGFNIVGAILLILLFWP